MRPATNPTMMDQMMWSMKVLLSAARRSARRARADYSVAWMTEQGDARPYCLDVASASHCRQPTTGAPDGRTAQGRIIVETQARLVAATIAAKVETGSP